MKRFLIFTAGGEYIEDALGSPQLLDGQQALEVALDAEITFHRPTLLNGEIVEGKTAAEFEEELTLASLIPSEDEQATAEFEIKTITLLAELGLI